MSSFSYKCGEIIINVTFVGVIAVIFPRISALDVRFAAVLQECSDQVPRGPNKLPTSLWGSNQEAAGVAGCVEATERRTKIR